MSDYITNEDVEIRLVGKVRFTDDVDEQDRMPRKLLKRLIREAQGQVERDLSPRYAAPFVSCRTGTFDGLPSTTKETLRTLCELAAVVRVLSTDFGKGSVTDGSSYKKQQQALYNKIIERELKQRVENAMGQWVYPPMDDLSTHLVNTTDTGIHGVILVTTRGDGDYPAKQITDPSENFWNGVIDE